MEVKTKAYPKVNLHLAVGKRKSDGFHEIASVFHLVDDSPYYDDITLTIEQSDSTEIKVSGLDGIADKTDNTIYKAVDLFCKASDFTASVKVSVVKRIPSQAGLGGGSSDAAAVLRVLNSIFPIGMERLMNIGALVGSDVPFFVSGYKVAAVFGRGEKVYPLEPKNLKITLYPNNNEKMSTALAYAKLDERKNIRPLPSREQLEEMYNRPLEEWSFYNDFEAVNTPNPDIRMKLTGSGTCRFTIDLK